MDKKTNETMGNAKKLANKQSSISWYAAFSVGYQGSEASQRWVECLRVTRLWRILGLKPTCRIARSSDATLVFFYIHDITDLDKIIDLEERIRRL